MDVSPEYVKQCDCPEIQNSYEIYRDKPCYMNDFKEMINPDDSPLWSNAYNVWLPRQDQLQLLSGLSWKEFDRECLKYDADTKEQAGIKVVIKRLTRLSDNAIM